MKKYHQIIKAIQRQNSNVKYQLKYVEYSEGMWTPLVTLTKKQIEKILNDDLIVGLKLEWPYGSLRLKAC